MAAWIARHRLESSVCMSKIVAALQAFALALGAPGLFIIGFLDSSFVPLPELNDLLLVFMVTTHKARMPLYAATAVLGSLAGCLVLYYIGRRGGASMVSRRFSSGRVSRTLETLQRYGVISVLVPCLLPPPAPFKIFMLLAGVAGISVSRFAVAILIGRMIRFFGLGFLALRFGDAALDLLRERGATVAYGLIGFLLAAIGVYLLWTKARGRKDR
jgi:membrane protein YqaA with SNARE-associated domain